MAVCSHLHSHCYFYHSSEYILQIHKLPVIKYGSTVGERGGDTFIQNDLLLCCVHILCFIYLFIYYTVYIAR